MCAAVLGTKDKDKYTVSPPVVSTVARKYASFTAQGQCFDTSSSFHEPFRNNSQDVDIPSYPHIHNVMSCNTTSCQTEQNQEKIELKRERSRRLAREFRARKKEEIQQYRNVIVKLTMKIREMRIENIKLRYALERMRGTVHPFTHSGWDMENILDKKHCTAPFPEQNLPQWTTTTCYPCQGSFHSVALADTSVGGQNAFTLPPLKTTWKDLSPCSNSSETQTRGSNIPSLSELTFSYCTSTQTNTADNATSMLGVDNMCSPVLKP